MSREEYEMIKQINEWKERKKCNLANGTSEDDDLIIEENTIYEIDFECYECLLKERKEYLGEKS